MKLKLGKLKSILDWSTPQEQVAVTILFADICGSTRLFEQYGDMRAVSYTHLDVYKRQRLPLQLRPRRANPGGDSAVPAAFDAALAIAGSAWATAGLIAEPD